MSDTSKPADEATEHGITPEGAHDAEPTGRPTSNRHRTESHPLTPSPEPERG
jgi:hypothetical protein